jgi:hypothetical protein
MWSLVCSLQPQQRVSVWFQDQVRAGHQRRRYFSEQLGRLGEERYATDVSSKIPIQYKMAAVLHPITFKIPQVDPKPALFEVSENPKQRSTVFMTCLCRSVPLQAAASTRAPGPTRTSSSGCRTRGPTSIWTGRTGTIATRAGKVCIAHDHSRSKCTCILAS